jgi:nicotinamide-nucleotide amidase
MTLDHSTTADIEETAIRLLAGRGETVATAESLTGGQLAALLTSVPGSSGAYLGGVVTYATALKVSLLGVPEEIVATDGVVSAACAEAMAAGVRRITGATYALSTTGVAGPERQEDKSVGTVYVGVAGPSGVWARELALSGARDVIQAMTCRRAVELLVEFVRREETPVG